MSTSEWSAREDHLGQSTRVLQPASTWRSTVSTESELFGTPLYAYHEIVHNRPVVERFLGRGVVFVDSIEEVPEGGTVLHAAHGVALAIREASTRRNLRAIDATCPLVTKVHMEAVRYAKEHYHIILIGHEGHDEVGGTMGERRRRA